MATAPESNCWRPRTFVGTSPTVGTLIATYSVTREQSHCLAKGIFQSFAWIALAYSLVEVGASAFQIYRREDVPYNQRTSAFFIALAAANIALLIIDRVQCP